MINERVAMQFSVTQTSDLVEVSNTWIRDLCLASISCSSICGRWVCQWSPVCIKPMHKMHYNWLTDGHIVFIHGANENMYIWKTRGQGHKWVDMSHTTVMSFSSQAVKFQVIISQPVNAVLQLQEVLHAMSAIMPVSCLLAVSMSSKLTPKFSLKCNNRWQL